MQLHKMVSARGGGGPQPKPAGSVSLTPLPTCFRPAQLRPLPDVPATLPPPHTLLALQAKQLIRNLSLLATTIKPQSTSPPPPPPFAGTPPPGAGQSAHQEPESAGDVFVVVAEACESSQVALQLLGGLGALVTSSAGQQLAWWGRGGGGEGVSQWGYERARGTGACATCDAETAGLPVRRRVVVCHRHPRHCWVPWGGGGSCSSCRGRGCSPQGGG